jgi:hypothetical protein
MSLRMRHDRDSSSITPSRRRRLPRALAVRDPAIATPATPATTRTALHTRIGSPRTVLPTGRRDRQERKDDVAATCASLSCVAVGAILYFAVAKVVSGVVPGSVGVILMIVGGLGLVASDLVLARARRPHIEDVTPMHGTTRARAGTTELQNNTR